jgi:hypothetical protein
VYRELRSLRDEVAQFRSERGENFMSEQRAAEIQAVVADVLADADTRASWLANGMTAGHENGSFFLASADGSFVLKIGGQVQARYLLNSRDGAGVDGWESGFSMRRVKLNFSGHVASPKLEYVVQLAANRDSGVVELEDAMLAYQLQDGLRIWAGRFQDIFAREAMMSSKRSQTVDRSAVANIFAANDGYVEGVGLQWDAAPDALKLYATINDGLNSGTPGGAGPGFLNGGNDFASDAADFAASARAEWKLAGDWKETADVVSWGANGDGDRDLHAFIGAGLHYEVGETGDGQASAMTAQIGPYDSFVQWTVDALVKCSGLGVMGSIYGWHFDATTGSAIGDTDHYAATIQAGYMVIPDRLEPFARYEWIDVDSALGANELSIVTVGANYYFAGHRAKLTGDVVWALDNINSLNTLGTGLSGIGLLGDASGEEDQLVGRLQFQLLF